MLVDVKSFFLHASRNTQAVYLVEYFEDDEAHTCRPKSDNYRTEYLCSEEARTRTVEQTFTGREQSGKYRSRETTYAVYGRCAYGVVNFQYFVNEFYGIYHQYATDGADDDRTHRSNGVASCRNAYQSRQNTVQRE